MALIQNHNLNFRTEELNLIISMLFNRANNKKFVTNVRTLFDCFSEDTIKSDYDIEVRVFLIKKLCELILVNNLNKNTEILQLLDISGPYFDQVYPLITDLAILDITDQIAYSCDKLISNKLKSVLIETAGSELVSYYTRFASNTYNEEGIDYEEALQRVEYATDNLSRSFKRVRETMEESKNKSISCDGNIKQRLSNILNKEKDDTYRIKTGLKQLNDMLGGGWERGRVYCALGPEKGWKSGFMFTVGAIGAKKFNKNLKPKDLTKKPVILYITLENTVDETYVRALSYAKGNNLDFKKMQDEDMYNTLLNCGYFSQNENDITEPSIMIQYKNHGEISTADIDVMLDDLEKDGYECVFLIIDYIKHLRPLRRNKEQRVELDDISLELCNLAKTRDLPILTAMQLNRGAIEVLQDTHYATIQDAAKAVRGVGASDIAECQAITMNVDCAFVIALHEDDRRDDDGNIISHDRYLFIRFVARRYRTKSRLNMIAARFAPDNAMRLMEDIELPGEQVYTVDATTLLVQQKPQMNSTPKSPSGRY